MHCWFVEDVASFLSKVSVQRPTVTCELLGMVDASTGAVGETSSRDLGSAFERFLALQDRTNLLQSVEYY